MIRTQYTRYRRWTRIAVLTETIEYVGPGPLGIHTGITPSSSPTLSEATPALTEKSPLLLPNAKTETDIPPQTPIDDDRSRLRQRLRAAVQNAH